VLVEAGTELRNTGMLVCVDKGKEKANEKQMYRITIRATDESVPPVLVKAMQDRLSQGIEGMA
jgi:hypothetical protein